MSDYVEERQEMKMCQYDRESKKAEEFINHEEILETLRYAEENKHNEALIAQILEKAKKRKGLEHREAMVLLDCDIEEKNQEIYALAEQIKKDFYGNRIVMFAPLYLSNYCVNGCVYCPYHAKNKHISRKKLTQEDLDKEVEMMDYAKAHYFDGIKGNNVSADKITENLHPFQEMYFDADGNAVWVYNISDVTDAGICADGYFDDPWEMEGAGYNKFRSSNNAVIQHENLVVIRPETPTEITITSWLSSERYGKYASSHPGNEALQKLYKQEVSVTVTVQPDSKVAEQLQTAIDHAQTLLDSVTEGTGAGQYPEGTRDKLQTAITEAKALLEREDAAETEIEQKVAKITALINTIQDSQNETEALVTVKINQEAGKGMDVSKMTVKAHTAANYGYSKPAAYKNKVTALDVLVAWHAAQYKDAFKANPTDYLAVNNGFINKIYGIETYSIGICVNDQIPGSASVAEAVVSSGDSVSVFMYGDLKQYKDIYLYFENVPETIQAGEKLDLTLWGMHPMDYDEKGNLKPASVQKGYTVSAVDANGNAVVSAITDENGKVSLTIPSGGTYQITVVKALNLLTSCQKIS